MNSPEAPWTGENQRAQLTGFTRFRAILWRRSLFLWEAWTIGRSGWYWKLRKRQRQAFQGLSLHDKSRLSQDSDIFGETPLSTVQSLLKLCRKLQPEHPRDFVDLGCGNGTPCFAAAQLGYRTLGYELERSWVEACALVGRQMEWPCRFECEDFFRARWPEPALVFVVLTAFSLDLREKLWAKFRAIGPGSLFLLGDGEPPPDFEVMWSGKLPVYWGIIVFSIARIKDEDGE